MSDDEPKGDYLFDGSGDPDPEIARLESLLAGARYVSKTPNERVVALQERKAEPSTKQPTRAPRFGRRTRVILAALAFAAVAVAVARGTLPRPGGEVATPTMTPPEASLGVLRVAGAPRIGERAIEGQGRLGVGAWLETDESSRADIALTGIGSVRVEPRSRVRLVVTGPNEQRLELAKGSIDAKVFAPPRIFVVDTPAARATDLGCAYRLEVDGDGGGLLRVTSGAVELAGDASRSWVPAGAVCETARGRGPGCPYFDDALDALKTALRRIDVDPAHPPPGAIDELVSAARRRDTLTLWHLRSRVSGAAYDLVDARIRALVPEAPDAGKVEDLVTHW